MTFVILIVLDAYANVKTFLSFFCINFSTGFSTRKPPREMGRYVIYYIVWHTGELARGSSIDDGVGIRATSLSGASSDAVGNSRLDVD